MSACPICGSRGHLSDGDLEAWEDFAAQAGDAATMLIASIARGVPARGLTAMGPAEIEAEWPRVRPASSGEGIVSLLRAGQHAAQVEADSWGSPWPEDAYDLWSRGEGVES